MSDGDPTDALARFAGGVAHDFNNLLTIINGYSELVLQELPAADPLRALVAEVVAAGERAGAITGQLLAVSGRQAMRLEVVDFNAVVAESAGSARLDLSPAACPVVADAGALAQLVRNLVGHFRGAVTVTTARVEAAEGAVVRLTVAGGGADTAPESVTRIFEPYASGGLGLAVAAGIARQLGGRATAVSGAGVAFVVELPATVPASGVA